MSAGVSVASAQHPQTEGILDRVRLWVWQVRHLVQRLQRTGRESSFTGQSDSVGPRARSTPWHGVRRLDQESGGATITAGNVSLAADYYRSPPAVFFLSAGVGFSRVETAAPGAPVTGAGSRIHVGAGLICGSVRTHRSADRNFVWGTRTVDSVKLLPVSA